MQKKDKKSEKSGGGMLFGALAGLAGLAIGYFMAKGEEEEKNKNKATPPIPVGQSGQGSEVRTIKQENMIDCDDCEDIICPITQLVMRDPYVSKKCGHSFEREAIQSWVSKRHTCPKCCVSLNDEDLIKNYTLKALIDKIISTQTSVLAQQ